MDCLQERLEQSAMVTSRLCHDFGNYLTGIMGFTELGLTQAEPDSIQHRFLSEVLTSAKQGAEWIRRLHHFCRRGAPQVWPSLFSSVVTQAEAAVDSGMSWVVDVPADLPLLAIDASSLQTILGELAANAREVMPVNGKLSISARVVQLAETDCHGILGSTRPGPHVEIIVADDGPGFAPEVRSRLFREIFFSTKPRHRGLGLLVVYGTLQRFRGGLTVDLPGQTPGACLRLFVPVAEIAGPALTANAEKPNLLLIYANAPLFESMRTILEARCCSRGAWPPVHRRRERLRSAGQSHCPRRDGDRIAANEWVRPRSPHSRTRPAGEILVRPHARRFPRPGGGRPVETL